MLDKQHRTEQRLSTFSRVRKHIKSVLDELWSTTRANNIHERNEAFVPLCQWRHLEILRSSLSWNKRSQSNQKYSNNIFQFFFTFNHIKMMMNLQIIRERFLWFYIIIIIVKLKLWCSTELKNTFKSRFWEMKMSIFVTKNMCITKI